MFAAAAGVVIAAGFVVVATFGWTGPLADLTFKPVVASAPVPALPVAAMTVAAAPIAAAVAPVAVKRRVATQGTIVGYPRIQRAVDDEVPLPLPAAMERSIEASISRSAPGWTDPGLRVSPIPPGSASGFTLTHLER
jgi:hypothetical protein